jgi:hypothetical protein
VIECAIEPRAGSLFVGTVRVPPPEAIEEMRLPLDGSPVNLKTVRLPGITHVIVPLEIFGGPGSNPRESALQAVGEWAPLIDAEAFGVLLYNAVTCSITPLVHVRGSDTTVWERGCGSGSAAVGAYIAAESAGNALTRVSQPGGVIEVDAHYEGGRVTALSITGKVGVAVRGTAYI